MAASTPAPRRSTSTCPTPGSRGALAPRPSTGCSAARGFVTPQPHKRPKSSWTRFCADFPNECWQADVTHVEVADGVVYEVLNVIDDHSRLCVASRAFRHHPRHRRGAHTCTRRLRPGAIRLRS